VVVSRRGVAGGELQAELQGCMPWAVSSPCQRTGEMLPRGQSPSESLLHGVFTLTRPDADTEEHNSRDCLSVTFSADHEREMYVFK